MKLAMTVFTVTVLAIAAGAAPTVDFNSYTPLDTCMPSISTGGLDFNSGVDCTGSYMYVWDGSSPNGNGTPALIFAGFGSGADVTISLAGGGTFNLKSVDMTLSWYNQNSSEVITVNGSPITLFQGLQTYNLGLSKVSSVTFSDLPSASGYWLMDNVVYSNVPEPGTLALLGSGALGVLGMLRRKALL